MTTPSATGHPPAPDESADDTRRVRGWRRWWTGLYAAIIAVAVVGGVVGGLIGHHRSGRPVHWAPIVVIVVVMVVVLAVTGVVGWRVQSRSGPTRQLLAAGNWRTNRRVGIALRRGRTVAPEDRRSAQAIVDVYARRRWIVWIYVGLGVAWLALAFGYHGFQFWLHLALGLFYLAFTPYWIVLRRRVLRHGAEQGLHPGLREATSPVP